MSRSNTSSGSSSGNLQSNSCVILSDVKAAFLLSAFSLHLASSSTSPALYLPYHHLPAHFLCSLFPVLSHRTTQRSQTYMPDCKESWQNRATVKAKGAHKTMYWCGVLFIHFILSMNNMKKKKIGQQAYTALVITQKIQNTETNIFSRVYNLSKKLCLSSTIYQLKAVNKPSLSGLLLQHALNVIIFCWLPPDSVTVLHHPVLRPRRQVPLSAGAALNQGLPNTNSSFLMTNPPNASPTSDASHFKHICCSFFQVIRNRGPRPEML